MGEGGNIQGLCKYGYFLSFTNENGQHVHEVKVAVEAGEKGILAVTCNSDGTLNLSYEIPDDLEEWDRVTGVEIHCQAEP